MRKLICMVMILLLFLTSGCIGQSSSDDRQKDPGTQQPLNEQNKQNNDNPSEQGKQAEKDTEDAVLKTDSGRYSGRIDNNFIEVKISGVPEPVSAKVFMLTPETNTLLETLNLQENEQIKIQYETNEHGQNIIHRITRL